MGTDRGGKRETKPHYTGLELHCHRQNDSSIKNKRGNDESHFNASLIVRDKVIRQCAQTTTFEERRAEVESNRGPSGYQLNASGLGQTGNNGQRLSVFHHFLLPSTS